MATVITLTFDDDDSALAALDYIGDSDAPVFLTDDSTVTVNGTTYELWEQFGAARDAINARG